MPVRLTRTRVAIAVVALVVVGMGLSAWAYGAAAPNAPVLDGPSRAGLNYGMPNTIDGQWVGTEWLRSRSIGGSWEATRPALAADLDFIHNHSLGHVIRLFVGLDQAMVWNAHEGFDGFDEPTLQHFQTALDMLDARGIKAVVVVFDQEVAASRGNFHVEALDGSHPAMRRHYLAALGEFIQRFGLRKTVVGWDLFNEAYNSLGPDGHLPAQPHADPTSPNYSDQTVHEWLQDLYRVAKQAAPAAQFTVSDTTELYWNPDPDLTKYQDVVDFFDIHVYDDHPAYPNWRSLLKKPYIVGEAGASTVGGHYEDQTINSGAVTYLLQHADSAGVSFVLVQGKPFTAARDSLTPTGRVLAQYLLQNPGSTAGRSRAANPFDLAVALVRADVSRLWRRIHS